MCGDLEFLIHFVPFVTKSISIIHTPTFAYEIQHFCKYFQKIKNQTEFGVDTNMNVNTTKDSNALIKEEMVVDSLRKILGFSL